MEGPGPVGTGRWTLGEIRHLTGDPLGDPGPVGGPTERSGMGGTLGEVKGTRWVVRGNLGEFRETHCVVRGTL